ncbi:glycosyltransferase [Vibrio gigantis]|uniref:Glycosyltransferase family 4 protein n=1 Tax=Vibrio gigantis TaxID=296199 RepID=A0A5M9NKH1_9VIBR|nr:glycosyltransferase [Vibrio gigantis]KAA8671136.1 glycosyltransferase family 4 protein [Vibrio gigantis]
MKIVQVMIHGSAHGFAGGTQKVMVELGNNFARRGHDVVSLYNDTEPGELFFKADFGAKIVNLESPAYGKAHKLWKALREVIKPFTKSKTLGQFFPNPVHLEKARMLSQPLATEIERIEPDIILVYGMQDHNSTCIGLKGSPLENTPIVHMVHCEVESYYNDLSYIDKRRIKSCSAVQALTPDFAATLASLLDIEVHPIANIVEKTDKKADLKSESRRKRIMMHSRLDKKKQQDMLLRSFALLKDDFPDWDLVVFGGENTKGYLKKLEGIVANHDMSRQVKICAPTPHALEELSQSDIFAFPSVHEEGWGLVLTEAMSVGLPCIGINSTSAINYLITSEDAGITVENDVRAFSLAMRQLMDSSELRVKFGKNAEQGMQKYYPDEVCSQWESLFNQVRKSIS